MGVTGLWKLIEPCGKPVPVETLEGKILAVDISIWLHQMIKGFQDQKGAALNNAHLLGLFHRLCKLMYYRIKPVFVFDGSVPQLKRDTIMLRQEQRSRLNQEADRLQVLLLQSLAKEELVQHALGKEATNALISSPLKKLMATSNRGLRKSDSSEDIFRLPEMIKNIDKNDDMNTDATIDLADTSAFLFQNVNKLQNSFSSGDDENSSFEDGNVRQTYDTNLQAIDVRSKHFLSLPADVRHEILVDIKETRKQSSWGRLHELPSDGNDFSTFQMKRLLKRHDVQVSLAEAEQEMGGHSLTYNELQNLLSEDGILEPTIAAKASQKIHSDDKTRFLLVKDLKKKLADSEADKDQAAKIPKISNEDNEDIESKPEEKLVNNSNEKSIFDDSDEEDDDLKLAIARSLEDAASKLVYNETDYKFGKELKLNRLQSKALKDATKGPARTYMIEYGGMNDSEVADLVASQNVNDSNKELEILNLVEGSNKAHNLLNETNSNLSDSDEDLEVLNTVQQPNQPNQPNNVLTKTTTLAPLSLQELSSTDSDSSDWENVENESDNDDKEKKVLDISITIDTKAAPKDDDLFADIFAIPIKEENVKDLSEKDKHTAKEDGTLNILAKLKEEIKEVQNITLDEVCSDDGKSNEINEIDELLNFKNKLAERSLKDLETPNQKISEIQQIQEKSPDCSKNVDKDNLNVENSQYSSESIMKESVEILKSKKTREELEEMAIDVADELKELENERNRQERMGTSITQRMNEDCQRMLRLFGIPYIVAPMEAEAQCAFLEKTQLTQGTITDDSDIWLFGGRTVYKNFFAQNKNVMEFRSEQIEKDFHCDRNKLIQLACLVGSDYTVGIRGIGAVTALEILALFSTRKSEVNKPQQINSTNISCQEIFTTLEKFRNWWQNAKDTAHPVGSTTRLNLLRKLKNIEICGAFPNMAVIEAYLLPRIDDSKDPFAWGQPDVNSIQEFTRQSFGWTTSKTNSTLEPVLKRLNEKKTQKSIINYFAMKKKNNSSVQFSQMSKRVQRAVRHLSDNLESDSNNNKDENNSPMVKTNGLTNKFKRSQARNKPIQLKKLQKKKDNQNCTDKKGSTNASKNDSITLSSLQ